jgi:hypothetical protein
MILTCKLSSLAWSYYDGGVSNEQIDKEMRGKDTFRKVGSSFAGGVSFSG